MSFTIATLWYERQRFVPGILAVAFSAVLIALQCGLLLGLFSITSLPIDETRADVWVGHPDVKSVDLGRPIPLSWQSYLAQPEITYHEPYLQGFAFFTKRSGGAEICLIIGSRLHGRALGWLNRLDAEKRALLTEPGSIVVDESEYDRLGIAGTGATLEITAQRVKVVGTISGYNSLAGPYIFCSLETARALLRMSREQTTFFLLKCRSPQDAVTVVERLSAEKYKKKLTVYTAPGFSTQSKWHWLTKTKAGIALGFAAVLGLLIGMVITSQTLYGATVASAKEFAVLRAMGIPRWRLLAVVLFQSFWVGIIGVIVAWPSTVGLAALATRLGARVSLTWWILLPVGVLTLLMAMLSGIAALRSLRQAEPATLLR